MVISYRNDAPIEEVGVRCAEEYNRFNPNSGQGNLPVVFCVLVT